MAGVTWFMHGSQAHAQEAEEDPTVRFVGRCGVQPLATALPTMEVDAVTGRAPNEACVACLISVALSQSEDEPMDEARQRGFEPVREDELDERGVLDHPI